MFSIFKKLIDIIKSMVKNMRRAVVLLLSDLLLMSGFMLFVEESASRRAAIYELRAASRLVRTLSFSIDLFNYSALRKRYCLIYCPKAMY